MNITKMIGMILLSVYLILTGLSTMSEVTMGSAAGKIVDLFGVGAGVLILISIGRFVKR